MSYFNIVAETSENTVVTEYEPVKRRSDSYQSEAELEQEFIRMLCEQGYEYLPLHTERDMINNLRERLQELNNYEFTDKEWTYFFNNDIANPNFSLSINSLNFPLFSRLPAIENSIYVSFSLVFALMG